MTSSFLHQFAVGSDNVIKNITSEVVRECARRRVRVDEPVVSLAVRLLCLDPANGLRLDASYERSDLEEFVAKCVARFSDAHHGPASATLHMQWFSAAHTIDVQRIAHVQETQRAQRTQKLVDEILGVRCKTDIDRERLLRKIAVDVIVNGALGSPANQQLCMDICTALKSVMSPADIAAFVAASRDVRLETLRQLRQVVCGIYIFNKDSGYCGDDMVDVGALVTDGQASTMARMSVAADEIKYRANLLSTVLSDVDVAVVAATTTKAPVAVGAGLAVGATTAATAAALAVGDVQLLQRAMVMQRQHKVLVRNLLQSLAEVKVELDAGLKAFWAELQTIRKRLQFKTAIPTEQIFPHFVNLSNCWHRLQLVVYTLTEINVVNERLMQQADDVCAWETVALDLLAAQRRTVQTDAERLKRESGERIRSANPDVLVQTYQPGKMRLKHGGFCTASLANSATGALFLHPANTGIGVCTYGGQHYAFRSAAAAQSFIEHPESCLFSIVERARAHPELIYLLECFEPVYAHRHDYHCAMSAAQVLPTMSGDATPTVAKASKSDADVQTSDGMELGPSGSGIVRDHCWNVWDYSRKAIQLANLMRSATTSAQTDVGYGRWGVNTQTWSPRSGAVQTRRDAATGGVQDGPAGHPGSRQVRN